MRWRERFLFQKKNKNRCSIRPVRCILAYVSIECLDAFQPIQARCVSWFICDWLQIVRRWKNQSKIRSDIHTRTHTCRRNEIEPIFCRGLAENWRFGLMCIRTSTFYVAQCIVWYVALCIQARCWCVYRAHVRETQFRMNAFISSYAISAFTLFASLWLMPDKMRPSRSRRAPKLGAMKCICARCVPARSFFPPCIRLISLFSP